MPHGINTVLCSGPDSPHAFDNVPLQPRNGTLDDKCPVCHGYGQWNTQIDLASFRCQRAVCNYCYGAGWVETGNDPIGLPDIVMSPEGYPKWIIRYVNKDGAETGQDRFRTLGVQQPAIAR